MTIYALTRKRINLSTSRLATLTELCRLLIQSRRWYLIPFVGVLSVASLLLLAVQIIEYVAPFVYTIF